MDDATAMRFSRKCFKVNPPVEMEALHDMFDAEPCASVTTSDLGGLAPTEWKRPLDGLLPTLAVPEPVVSSDRIATTARCNFC
jgi:hypothetical protein